MNYDEQTGLSVAETAVWTHARPYAVTLYVYYED
jgi:hypothetical protein